MNGRQLRRNRGQRGMPHPVFGQRLNVSQRILTGLTKGNKQPYPKDVAEIAKLFGIPESRVTRKPFGRSMPARSRKKKGVSGNIRVGNYTLAAGLLNKIALESRNSANRATLIALAAALRALNTSESLLKVEENRSRQLSVLYKRQYHLAEQYRAEVEELKERVAMLEKPN